MPKDTMEIDPKLLDAMRQVTVFDMLRHLGYNVGDFVFAIPEWEVSIKAAFKRAKAEKKIVMALFTGPTWCGPCAALETEVIKTGTFNAWAAKTAVLLRLESSKGNAFTCDDPDHEAFRQKHKVTGWPTAIGFDSDETERGRAIGYFAGDGPVKYLKGFETAAGLGQCSGGFCPMP